MKYVMMEVKLNENCVQNIPVIFPNTLVHSEMKDLCLSLLERSMPGYPCRVVSAGDITLTGLKCSGSSSSLGISSRPEDSQIIHLHDYFSGLEDTDEEIPEENSKIIKDLFVKS